MGTCGTVSVLLDGSDLFQKLQRIQFGIHSEVFYPVADFAELCGCVYGGSVGKIFLEYGAVYGCDNRLDAGGDHTCGIRFCQTGFPRKKRGVCHFSFPDDDPKRAGDHHELCDDHESESAQFVSGTDPAFGDIGILHLSVKRKF